MAKFQVVVGNVGTVFDGDNKPAAEAQFQAYVNVSKEGCGRAAGEPVTLFHNGEIAREYLGTLNE